MWPECGIAGRTGRVDGVFVFHECGSHHLAPPTALRNVGCVKYSKGVVCLEVLVE